MRRDVSETGFECYVTFRTQLHQIAQDITSANQLGLSLSKDMPNGRMSSRNIRGFVTPLSDQRPVQNFALVYRFTVSRRATEKLIGIGSQMRLNLLQDCRRILTRLYNCEGIR